MKRICLFWHERLLYDERVRALRTYPKVLPQIGESTLESGTSSNRSSYILHPLRLMDILHRLPRIELIPPRIYHLMIMVLMIVVILRVLMCGLIRMARCRLGTSGSVVMYIIVTLLNM